MAQQISADTASRQDSMKYSIYGLRSVKAIMQRKRFGAAS